MKNSICILIATTIVTSAFAAPTTEGFKSLFNGKDLTGWDGNPELWSVQDGCITGITKEEPIPYNQFLIWRGGTVKNFELRAKIKQTGNNSGIQYRSKELKEVGQWAVGGYQCDVHPTPANNAMVYEEKGRGIIAQNGQNVIIDAQGDKWLLAQTDPVSVDVEDWNEYSIIAVGNKVAHMVNGRITAMFVDHQADKRSLEGLLAFQVHRGPAMEVQIKDVMLKEMPDGGVLTPEQTPIPPGAKKIGPPKPAAKKEGKKKKEN